MEWDGIGRGNGVDRVQIHRKKEITATRGSTLGRGVGQKGQTNIHGKASMSIKNKNVFFGREKTAASLPPLSTASPPPSPIQSSSLTTLIKQLVDGATRKRPRGTHN